MDAIELAKGIALRQAEQFGPYQRRTTYAFSDWLDRHCDELLEAAEALSELRGWLAASAAVYPTGHFNRACADVLAHLDALRETPAPPQAQEPK